MINLVIIFGAKYLIAVIVAIAVIFWFVQKKDAMKKMTEYGAWTLAITYVLDVIASMAYYNPRPFISEQVVPLISHAATNGFPSDHTILSTALAVIVFRFNKKLGALMFVLAFLVGTSRVLAGVHHWLDIFAGLLLPIVGGLLSVLLTKYSFKPKLIA